VRDVTLKSCGCRSVKPLLQLLQKFGIVVGTMEEPATIDCVLCRKKSLALPASFYDKIRDSPVKKQLIHCMSHGAGDCKHKQHFEENSVGKIEVLSSTSNRANPLTVKR